MEIYLRCLYLNVVRMVFFFFFQAEDGIRDLTVTGVQTCALPICYALRTHSSEGNSLSLLDATPHVGQVSLQTDADAITVCIGDHTTVRFAISDYRDRKSVV